MCKSNHFTDEIFSVFFRLAIENNYLWKQFFIYEYYNSYVLKNR